MVYRRRKFYDPLLAFKMQSRADENDGVQSLNVFIDVKELEKIQPLLKIPEETAGAFRVREYSDDGTAILTYPEFSSAMGDHESTLMLNEPFGFHTHPDVVYEDARLNQPSVWPSSTDFESLLQQYSDQNSPNQLSSIVMAGEGVCLYRIHEHFQKLYEDQVYEEIIDVIVDWVRDQEDI